MEHLKERDFYRLLDLIQELYSVRDIGAFRSHAIGAIARVVPSEVTGYNEINTKTQQLFAVNEPPIITADDLVALESNMDEHPLIDHYSRTADGRATAISDFLDVQQFHRLEMYNEFYRKFHVEDQLGFVLPSQKPFFVAIALNRSRRSFTSRDRMMINLLRPHMATAYENSDILTRLNQALDPHREVVTLATDGKPRQMSDRARRWLVDYFGLASQWGDGLPEALDLWVKEQGALRGKTDRIPPPHRTLTIDRVDGRLTVRFISGIAVSMLVLEDKKKLVAPERLATLGLTSKEAEVLTWVAMGKTNKDVSQILGVSSRTVQKHLEHLFLKLGVETRTAAAAMALENDGNS